MGISYYFSQFLRRIIGNHYLAFICYADVNENQAIHIKNILENAGGFPFMFKFSLEPGDESVEVIESNIKNCDLFVPLLTEQSVDKAWVQNEIGAAKILKKEIFSVLLGDEQIIKPKLGVISGLNFIKYEDSRLEKKLTRKVHRYLLKQLVIITLVVGFIVYRYFINKG